jgi:hypothetical protein
VLSIFVGIISALALVIWELLNAPMGYESEDGFHIAYENSLLPQRWRAAHGAPAKAQFRINAGSPPIV